MKIFNFIFFTFLGENNKAAFMDPKTLSAHEKTLFEVGYAKNFFNQLLSDRISVTRRLPDIRSSLYVDFKRGQYGKEGYVFI